MSSDPLDSKKAHPIVFNASSPIPGLGLERYSIQASSGASGLPGPFTTSSNPLNASTLPAYSGSYLRTQVIDVRGWDSATLEIAYDGNASSTTGYPLIVPFGSNAPMLADDKQVIPPPLTDDTWYNFCAVDGTITATALTGSLGIGSGSVGPLMGYQKVYGEVIQPSAITANSGKIRQSVPLKVRGYNRICFAVAERGDTTNPGKLQLFILGVV